MGASTLLRVGVDSGTFVITGGERARRLRLAAGLRAQLGDVVRPCPGGYRVSVAAAQTLANLLASDSVEWAAEARLLVESDRKRRTEHLAASAEIAEAISSPDEVFANLDVKLPLDRHQKEAAAAIASPSSHGLALFDEQGTGKTMSALGGFALLRARGLVERVLVVAPKSVLGAWATDARRLLGGRIRIATMQGSARQRRAAVLAQHDVLLANYEAVVADLALLDLVIRAKPERYLLVVDESYFAKNPETRRSEAILALRQHCRRAVVLCGTPAPNAAWDIVNQVNLADGGIAFGAVVRPRDPDDARERVLEGLGNALYLRRLKSQVLALPGQNFLRVAVKMQPVQRLLYDKTARELVLELRSITDDAFHKNLAHYLARRQALLQICSQPGTVDPLYVETPAKLVALDTLLSDLIERRGEKAVVWSWYRASLDAVARRYARYGVARIDGSVPSSDDRTAAIEMFQTDPNTRLFVGNAAAAGAGITLTAARTAVYESFSNQAAHYMQSLDRIHRRGQDREVTYVILVCDDSVEESEYERLVAKQQAARDLLGDDFVAEPTRTVFLSELERGLYVEPAD